MHSPNPPNRSPSGPISAVRYETTSGNFDKPLPRSTFHDMVNRGTIVPMKGLKGFYKLNESLCRMGLKPVPSLPEGPGSARWKTSPGWLSA